MLANSAASTHIANSEKGLYDVKAIHKPVKIGDSKLVYTTKIGWFKVSYKSKEKNARTKNSS